MYRRIIMMISSVDTSIALLLFHLDLQPRFDAVACQPIARKCQAGVRTCQEGKQEHWRRRHLQIQRLRDPMAVVSLPSILRPLQQQQNMVGAKGRLAGCCLSSAGDMNWLQYTMKQGAPERLSLPFRGYKEAHMKRRWYLVCLCCE